MIGVIPIFVTCNCKKKYLFDFQFYFCKIHSTQKKKRKQFICINIVFFKRRTKYNLVRERKKNYFVIVLKFFFLDCICYLLV